MKYYIGIHIHITLLCMLLLVSALLGGLILVGFTGLKALLFWSFMPIGLTIISLLIYCKRMGYNDESTIE